MPWPVRRGAFLLVDSDWIRGGAHEATTEVFGIQIEVGTDILERVQGVPVRG